MSTIIAGCPRSGTTLALRVLCPQLTKEDLNAGGIYNEPQTLTHWIAAGEMDKALLELPKAFGKFNKFGVIKSPYIGVMLPYVPLEYNVICTFRDLRMVVPSLIAHHNAVSVLGERAFWRPWVGKFNKMHPFDLIMRAWMAVYQGVADYRGPVTVWNYGFWDEWKMPEESIEHLYVRSKETSAEVLEDIESGKVFSDATVSLERWQQFIEEYNVTSSQLKRYQTLRNHLERAFRCRGRIIRFLD